MTAIERPRLLRYCLAVLSVVVGLLVMQIPAVGSGLGIVLFFAVLLSAWYGGAGPALLSNALIVFLAVADSAKKGLFQDPSKVAGIVLFAAGGVLITMLVEALHAARRRAEESTAEARRHEETLRRSEEALRGADRRKDEFLAMLAHELRNPLASISGAVQLLRQPGWAGDREWGTEVIERQARHLARLIDDLLDVSRVSRGKVQLRKEWLDLRAVVERAVDAMRPQAAERGHALTMTLPDLPLGIVADPTRLEQVVTNLLANAVKYTEPGGRIALEAGRAGDELVLTVRDSGVGIAPEMLPHIFGLFTQVDQTLDRSEGGLGIGLTLVRSLAELHGGRVSAASAGPGKGSEFTVRLPASAPPAALVAERAGVAAPAPEPTASRTLKVLVVDDNADAARALARLLRHAGHEARVCHDGPSSLDAARAERPDVVLLDIGLPGMSGYEVAERLRRDDAPRGRGLTLIAVSGYGQERDILRSREAGIDHHMVKPVEFDDLLGALDRIRRNPAETPSPLAGPHRLGQERRA